MAKPSLWISDIVRRITLALLSAALLVASLPRLDFGWLGWVALVPLLLAMRGCPPSTAGGLGLIAGITASFGIYGWLFEVPNFDLRHAVVLALYVGSYPAVWAASTAWLSARRVPLTIAAPTLWLVMDYVRAHAGFLALPWGTLAQTQHLNLAFLQTATLFGEHGLTSLVATGNAALAGLLLRQERLSAALALILVAVAHVWGFAELQESASQRPLSIAAIQPNIQIEERQTEAGRANNLARLERLTREASAGSPFLIVWPESAIPGDLADPALRARIQVLVDETGIPLMLGAAEVEKFSTGEGPVTMGRHAFNTAHLFRPGERPAKPYRKRVLVPFAEYLPHPDVIPWPEWLAPRVMELTPGDETPLFLVTSGLSVGPLICWENLFAPLARESVNDGANVLVQLTNDVWFGRSAAPWQHNLMSVMRAAENRTPIVIASNSGPSQLVDGHGRVVATTGRMFAEGYAIGTVAAGTGGTLYTTWGDSVLLILLIPLLLYWYGVWARSWLSRPITSPAITLSRVSQSTRKTEEVAR